MLVERVLVVLYLAGCVGIGIFASQEGSGLSGRVLGGGSPHRYDGQCHGHHGQPGQRRLDHRCHGPRLFPGHPGDPGSVRRRRPRISPGLHPGGPSAAQLRQIHHHRLSRLSLPDERCALSGSDSDRRRLHDLHRGAAEGGRDHGLRLARHSLRNSDHPRDAGVHRLRLLRGHGGDHLDRHDPGGADADRGAGRGPGDGVALRARPSS